MTLDRAIDRMGYRPPRLEPGHVWLAGAGPGDPGCLTLDVLSALAEAGTFDLSGFMLTYGRGDNRGSEEVFLTVIREGQIVPAERLAR